ncbi:sigma-70 family RNA polymerase sigma factor [Mesorhizobium neociceri]|uniref:sigma-70 family RNA polymerase sigma factor n=1 Tax=Mesorhizobium neociceri TaxID=1307853 RepID=UPI002E2D719B|nr:sigma-70 family RNA polymerase sigma factor [Mesorhizobium neociceri]
MNRSDLMELDPLDLAEIRLIADNRTEQLAGFASSPRVHAVDPKGDTPLHIAARMGNLALCDLFIRSGADPGARNHDRQSPADVASAEGHLIAAQLLFSLVGGPHVDTSRVVLAEVPRGDVGFTDEHALPSPAVEPAPFEPDEDQIALDDRLNFEPEEDAEHYFDRSAGDSASGTFVALVTSSPTDSTATDVDWEIELSSAQIAGDGIGSEAAITPDHGGEHDFLKVGNRGRQSTRRAVVSSGTRLSIDPEYCLTWAAEILEKRYFSSEDLDTLISLCEGNGETDDLRFNLIQLLERAGLELFDEAIASGDILWDIRSDVSTDGLAEAIEAAFSRATRLPGTRRFDMDKSDEARLLAPLLRAKQQLQLWILSCEPAVKAVLGAIDKVLDGSWKPDMVTMRPLLPSRPENAETAAFSNAGQILRSWNSGGRVMDGRRRREALEALETLDLSPTFHNAIMRVLAQYEPYIEASHNLDGLISAFEMAIERLILEHLPYARRFAARSVEEGEDPEDVFQVAFLGLQRASRRFDPERGHRFIVYSTFWMRQALARWRADEGAIVRIPVHRHQKLTELDRTVEKLEGTHGRFPTVPELVAELGWDTGEVEQLLCIPRHHSGTHVFEDWDGAISTPDQEVALCQMEIARIVSEALAELPDRQADVVSMRFGIGREDEMTLEEIGQVYGVTRERIRQIEAKAFRYLTNPGRIRGLKSLLGM